MATLDAVLQALPSDYSKDTHKIIKEHATNLTRTFTNLKPMIPPPNIRPPKLQQCSFILEGTIPVTCIMGGGQTGNFNIPIRIWLEPKYPKQWPTVMLNPTANMIIAQNHKHVDAQGVCYCQYLTDWVRDTKKKNLMDLILELCRIFGGAPPLYEQRQPVQPVQPPPGHWGNQGLHNGYVPPAGAGYPPQYFPTQQFPMQPMAGYSNPISGPPLGVPPPIMGGHATGPQPTPTPPAPAPVAIPPTPAPAVATPTPAVIPPSLSAAVEEDNQCVVCMSDKKSMLFLPCRHLATCEACAGLIGDSCPTCRAKIETKMKIYT